MSEESTRIERIDPNNLNEKLSTGLIYKLKLFHKKALELKKNKEFIFSDLSILINYKQLDDDSSVMNQTFKRVDERLFKSVLIDIRPFWLKREDCHFPEFCDILLKETQDPILKERTLEALDFWNKVLNGDYDIPVLNIGSEKVIPKESLDQRLNAFYYHSDSGKIKKIEELEENEWGKFASNMIDQNNMIALRNISYKICSFHYIVVVPLLTSIDKDIDYGYFTEKQIV